MTRTAVLARTLGLIGAVVAFSTPAHAYVRTTTDEGLPMRWGHTGIPLLIYTGDPSPSLSAETFLAAATAAARVWSHSGNECSKLDLVATNVAEGSAPVGFDRKNRVTFRRTSWCKEPRKPDEPCYDPSALAITSVFARKSDGTILDSDMEINAQNFSWADLVADGAAARNSQDIQNTLTHEFGHIIGLDHTCILPGTKTSRLDHAKLPVPNCQNANPDVRATTMFAAVVRGDISRRDLELDDIQAVCDVYPTNSTLPYAAPDDDSGGCQVSRSRSGGPGPFSGAAALLFVALLLRVGRRRPAG